MVYTALKSIFDFIWDLFFSIFGVGVVYGVLTTNFIYKTKLGVNFYYLVSVEYREYWEHYFIYGTASTWMLIIVGFCAMRFCPEDASVLEILIATFSVLIFPILLLISVTVMLNLGMHGSSNLLFFHLFQIIFSVVYSLFVSKIYSPKKATSLSPNYMSDDSQSSELRDCPFCYEKIQQKAIKCRFCGEMV